VVVAVEFAVSVVGTELADVTFTDAGMEQVTGLVGLAGVVVTAQLRVTVPVKALAGVTFMVEVLPVFTF
jgi:cell division ATPase FtsA